MENKSFLIITLLTNVVIETKRACLYLNNFFLNPQLPNVFPFFCISIWIIFLLINNKNNNKKNILLENIKPTDKTMN